MLILYTIFILLLVISFRILKHENAIIIGGIFLLMYISGTALFSLPNQYINYIFELLSLPLVISILSILILFFLLSQLLWLLGFQKYIEQAILFKSKKIQQLYILFLAILTSNISYSKSYLVNKNTTLLDSNSFILSTLNIFSPIFITVNVLVILTMDIYISASFALLIMTNIVAWFWLFKKIIDILTSREFEYEINQKRIIKYKVYEDESLNNYTKFKDLFIITPILSVITLVLVYLGYINFFNAINLVLLILVIITFVKSLKYSYKNNLIAETTIYMSIIDSLKDSFTIAFLIINTSIITKLLYLNFIEGVIYNSIFDSMLLFGFTIIAILILLYSKRYEFAAITLFPIFGLITFDRFTTDIFVLICVAFAFILIARQVSIVKPNKKVILDLVVSIILISISYIVFIMTHSFMYLYLTLFITLVIYLIFNLTLKEKV